MVSTEREKGDQKMEITSKKVITEYSVEIGFNEYWETLNEILDYWLVYKEVKPMWAKFNGHYKQYMELFVKVNKGKITLEGAKKVFEDILDDMNTLVVSQIAENNGFTVSNFGSYSKVLKIRTATFVRSGNHI